LGSRSAGRIELALLCNDMPIRGAQQLQRSAFRWVQVVDETNGVVPGDDYTRHATITSAEVAQTYGVPHAVLIKHVLGEIEEMESCMSLPFTLLMFVVYAIIVITHYDNEPVNAVEDSITHDIVENANFAFSGPWIGHKGIDDVNSYADFWSWMVHGFLPLIFIQAPTSSEGRVINYSLGEWSNVSSSLWERGYLLQYNKIIGGVRVQQERGHRHECETMPEFHEFYGKKCVGPSGYELFPEMSNAKMSTDPQGIFWLYANENLSNLTQACHEREARGWLNEATRKVEVAIPVFNGELGVYSIVYVDFFFSRGGHIWKRIIPLSTYFIWFRDLAFDITIDVVWVSCLLWIFCSETFKIWGFFRIGGWKSVRSDYLRVWNILDWTAVGYGAVIIIWFYMVLRRTERINSELLKLAKMDDQVERAAYHAQVSVLFDMLEVEVHDSQLFRLFLGCYPVLTMARLFKAFAAQPRLSIVTRTLSKAGADLIHFLLVFISVFLTYVIAGIVLFGREVDNFTNFNRSVITSFRAMMGDFDWDAMMRVGRPEAFTWFFTFMVTIVLLLMNMLLAIVMDSYQEQKAIVGDAETLWDEATQFVTRTRGIRAGRLVRLKDVLKALRNDTGSFSVVRSQRNLVPQDSGQRSSKGEETSGSRSGSGSNLGTKPSRLSWKTSSNSSTINDLDEYVMITCRSLQVACGLLGFRMDEAQATLLIESAIKDFYIEHEAKATTEEMLRIICKVNHGTKRLKRKLKDLVFKSKERGEVEQEPLDKSGMGVLRKCHEMLLKAKEAIPVKGRNSGGEAHLRPLQTLEEAEVGSEKVILHDEDAVLSACRMADIGDTQDHLRRRSLGQLVRILENDEVDMTVKCQVPGVGDVWFAVGALAHASVSDHEANNDDFPELERDGARPSSDAGVSLGSSGSAEAELDDIVLRTGEVEHELQMGHQTVSEAFTAISELEWRLLREDEEKAKVASKFQLLKQKVVSLTRESQRLMADAQEQDKRLDTVSASRDEYKELVQTLRDENQRLKSQRRGALALTMEPHVGRSEPAPQHPAHRFQHLADRLEQLAEAMESDTEAATCKPPLRQQPQYNRERDHRRHSHKQTPILQTDFSSPERRDPHHRSSYAQARAHHRDVHDHHRDDWAAPAPPPWRRERARQRRPRSRASSAR